MAELRLFINSKQALEKAKLLLDAFWEEHKHIQGRISDKRNLDQNAAIRVAYKQIQEVKEGWTAKDVERHCKLIYGVPILRKNDIVKDWLFRNTIDKGLYEQQLLMMDAFNITSDMSKSEACEMIDCMIQDFPHIVIEKP